MYVALTFLRAEQTAFVLENVMEYIGVAKGGIGSLIEVPVRELLLVDRVAVIDLDRQLSYREYSSMKGRRIDHLEALHESGLVFQPSRLAILQNDEEPFFRMHYEWMVMNRRLDAGYAYPSDNDRLIELQSKMATCEVRGLCESLRRQGFGAVPFYPTVEDSSDNERRHRVIEVVMKKLPVVSLTTPPQAILDFRSDADSLGAMAGLRTWIAETARGDLQPFEIEDKLDYLLYQYRKALELHKLRYEIGTLESTIVTVTEVLEDLVSFRWSKLAKTLFSVRQRKIDLTEAEMRSPGAEVSYLVKANNRF